MERVCRFLVCLKCHSMTRKTGAQASKAISRFIPDYDINFIAVFNSILCEKVLANVCHSRWFPRVLQHLLDYMDLSPPVSSERFELVASEHFLEHHMQALEVDEGAVEHEFFGVLLSIAELLCITNLSNTSHHHIISKILFQTLQFSNREPYLAQAFKIMGILCNGSEQHLNLVVSDYLLSRSSHPSIHSATESLKLEDASVQTVESSDSYLQLQQHSESQKSQILDLEASNLLLTDSLNLQTTAVATLEQNISHLALHSEHLSTQHSSEVTWLYWCF